MLVELGHQVVGDAVRALVLCLDPAPALAVLDADGGHACEEGAASELAPHSVPRPRQERPRRAFLQPSCCPLPVIGTRVLSSGPGIPGPRPTCDDAALLLHQLNGCLHGAPRLDPLIHQQDAQAWGGGSVCQVPPRQPALPSPCLVDCSQGPQAPWGWTQPLSRAAGLAATSPGVMASVLTSITFWRKE